MGLFGGGNSSNDNSVNIDSSVRSTDRSRNFNNQGASIGNTSTDNSVTNITDGGAFEVAQSALDMGDVALRSGFEFGGNALDVTDRTFRMATDLTRDVNAASMDFGSSTLDAAVNAIGDSNDHASQIIGQTIDKSLSVASQATRTDSETTMQGLQKIGLVMGVVFIVGFIAIGMRK